MRRGLLIYNPTAGQRNRRAQMLALIDTMRGKGMELVNAPTEGPGHATEIVRAFLPRGLDVVAACGGDGTISEVACGLAGSSTPLAILPGGTSNVLVRELKIPLDLARASRLLLEGIPRPLQLLLANDRPFLLWAGIGLDARIMGNTNALLKRWLGRAGIFFTVAREFFRYEFPRLEITIDGTPYPATFAVVSHVRHYGGTGSSRLRPLPSPQRWMCFSSKAASVIRSSGFFARCSSGAPDTSRMGSRGSCGAAWSPRARSRVIRSTSRSTATRSCRPRLRAGPQTKPCSCWSPRMSKRKRVPAARHLYQI